MTMADKVDEVSAISEILEGSLLGSFHICYPLEPLFSFK